MKNLVDSLTALVLGVGLLGGGWRGIAKLTRIADSVERLSGALEHVVSQTGDHEKRITHLEAHQ